HDDGAARTRVRRHSAGAAAAGDGVPAPRGWTHEHLGHEWRRRRDHVHDARAAEAGLDERAARHIERPHRHVAHAVARARAPVPSVSVTDPRRAIPPVDRLLSSPAFAALLAQQPRALVVEALQTVQDDVRAQVAAGGTPPSADEQWYAEHTREVVARLTRRSLLPLIIATGVVLHPHLGRAPLAQQAIAAMTA